MEQRVVGWLLLAGAAAASGSGCGGSCEMPEGRVTVTLPAPLEHDCEVGFRVGFAWGAVSHAGGELVVEDDRQSLAFPDLGVDIPDGTLVSVTVDCQTGRLVVVRNLPSLGAKKNPTEDGTRVWTFVAAGGRVGLVDDLPFSYALEEACKEGNDRDGYLHAEAIVLIDGAHAVIVPPGQTGEVEVHEGDQAGKWEIENVNVVFSDEDEPIDVHLRIRRGD